MTLAGEPATLPPAGLPGLNPAWSRLVDVRGLDGAVHGWHLLDSHADRDELDQPTLTLLCVHGNPTWSYLWRSLIAQAPSDIRVIAVDQLEMGFSERTGGTRLLSARIADLTSLTTALNVTGPVVTVAHDWGGPVSLGWALEHREQLRGVVLLNTAVHQPAESPAPAAIRIARSAPLLRPVTEHTALFVRATTAMSRSFLSASRMTPDVARAFLAPYGSARRRAAVGDFVADIPLESTHPSADTLDRIAEGVRDLADVPVLLLWGPNDPVFSDLYLDDLAERMPHADIHRYERASHLVIEDAPSLVPDLLAWLESSVLNPEGRRPTTARSEEHVLAPGLLDALRTAAVERPDALALVEMGEHSAHRVVTWALLQRRIDDLARGLRARGIRPGDRVSILIPPSADLVAVVYACWSMGACAVIADTGLGAAGIRRAIRGAAPDHVIGVRAGLALARTLRMPGQRISARDLRAIADAGAQSPDTPDPVDGETEAVVVFTSGATGPAKGVIYRQRQVAATIKVLRDHYSLTTDDALIAAFAPWAVLGPALGITSVIPDMDVTAPGTLTARALARATAAVQGTVLWASPAALANVVATADSLHDDERASFSTVRLALAAGAPVPVSLLREVARLMPAAQVRTPYGMTEALPLTDTTLAEIEDAGRGNGVLVGSPLPGVSIAIAALDALGSPSNQLTTDVGITGEIALQAAHMRDGYDRLWATSLRAGANPGWHRTGDVGHLDEQGRLWIEGRLAHVIVTPAGPATPVGIEQRLLDAPFVTQAAVVGVGPAGTAQLVAIVVIDGTRTRSPLLDAARTQELRALAERDFAAVLVRTSLPMDIRHNSKIDRAALAQWAQEVLAGARSA